MNVQQYEAALHWFYDKIEAIANSPEPTIRWLGEDPVVLQAGWPIDLREVPVGELSNNLASLVKVLGYILNRAISYYTPGRAPPPHPPLKKLQ